MLIVCPTCATTYQIQLAALGAAGRSVRCAHCKNTWFATADSVVEEAMLVTTPAAAPTPRRPSADEPGAEIVHDIPEHDVLPPERPSAPPVGNPFTVADAPPLVPQDHPEMAGEPELPKFDPGVPDDETPIARRARQTYVERKSRRTLLQRLLSLPTLIVVLLAVLLGALNWRASVVRHFPQTASLYATIGLPVNLRGLFFQDVKSTVDFQDGVSVLVIEGTIVNLTTRTLEVPRLRLALRNAAGHEVYAWNAMATKSTLGSGNGLPFRARLASPPPDGRDVIVRFFNRRDVSAGSP